MTFSQEASGGGGGGRARQRARTRQALLDAGMALVREGRPPSMPEAAERALVSVPTAYRYFPTAEALWEEAAFELSAGDWTPAVADEGGDDVAARLDRVITSLGWHMLDDEGPYRIRARAGLDAWFRRGDGDEVPVREGRRREWNARVLAPLEGRLDDADLADLLGAIGLVWGPEAVIALRDACRLAPDDAKRVMRRAARWMVAGALAELGAAAPGGGDGQAPTRPAGRGGPPRVRSV